MTDSSKPPSGRRMKARAPPLPPAPQPAPRHIFRNTVPDGGGTSGLDTKENLLRPTVHLQLTLPQGFQTNVTEDGSKALMDLLVELCSRYHLNPSLHTLELLSPEGHSLGFKPNALLGSLDVACVLIKEKVWEEKVVRRPAPKVPEKTVRLMVNYHSSQKAVVRVNPLVPLQALIAVICDKCDFEPAHVLLLKDSISRHELPLDKSLTDLGIKELYVHDQSLVLQPKMASAPALNYSDSIRSSTNSLGRAEKKGILGIFQFSRRKSKTETPMDTDGLDDKVVHSTDTQSNGLSTVSVVSSVEERPNTLGQSQSVMDIPRMSPKAENKKRRAPALPGGLGLAMRQTSFEGYQMGLGSESQQRKRKAPAPPPTPASITPDDTSTSAPATPDSQEEEIPTITFRTNVAQSTTVAATTVVTQTVKSEPPPPVCTTAPNPTPTPTPTPSSPSPSSSSTTDSMPLQDSSSELSHSLEDSDLDLDQTSSHYSNVTSSTASGSVRVQPAAKSSSTRVEEQEKASTVVAKAHQERTSASSSMSETESALNLRLDEVENNRQSAIEASDRPAPPKPRRSSTKEAPQPVLPPTPSSPPHEPTQRHSPQSSMEAEEAAPQSWLHSTRSSTAGGQKAKAETLEEETVSLGSSSSGGGGSLPDQGYAASEGMAEGEVSSPSDTQPTSPDGSLSLDGCGGGERLLGPVRDNSSDSDEGCATWGSRHRHDDISPQKSGRLKDSYQDDPELTAELHQTLADFEAGLADHIHIVSAKETAYTMSTDSNEVPVSVVDMDVPVTAIDEVLEDYECNTVDNEGKSLTRTESAGSKGPGFCLKSSLEPQNKNNNACTTAEGNKRSSANTQQPHSKPLESRSSVDKQEEKILKGKMKETNITHTKRVKEDKQRTTSTVKSNGDVQRPGKSAEINPEPVKSNAQSLEGKKPVIPPTIQRSTSTERDEEMHRVNQNNSNTSLGKITHTSTSRFGLKTFTVVPQKPPVVRNATEVPAVTLSVGAIKIDDQGNMVKEGTISRNKFGGSSEAGINCSEESPPLLGKAKAFWSSNERQERDVPHNKGVIDKAKESTDCLKSTPTAISETTLIKTRTTEDLKTAQTSLNNKPAERAQLKEMVREESKSLVIYVQVAEKEHGEEESKISALPPPILPKKDLSFLKPSRRTSSQYVASAINKYAPKTSVKPNSIPNKPDSSASSKTHTYGLQRSGRSMQVNPQQSSRSSVSDHKDIQSASKSDVPGPKRSMSFPEYVSDGRRGFGEVRPERGGFGSCVASSNAPETETTKSRHVQSSGSTPTNMTARNDRDHIKDIRPRSPSPAQNRPVRSFAKPPTAPKTVSLGQASNTRDMTNTATHLTPDAKPKAAVAVADSGVSPGPPLVTVFGTVQKFRPVICKSVEKETSLHGNLMEAIQTGGGRDRLKKITTSGPSSMKKASYVDEENERDALLAAIRAKSSSGRLNKTKSEAADELERFRKTSEGEKAAGLPPSPSPSPPFSTRTSPPVFAPPPPAPPPPLLLPQVKPSTVAHPSANAPENPGLTREAMLEAIRSGSAAERLKKVAAPTKTLKVNGRLGTIRPTSSTLPHQ